MDAPSIDSVSPQLQRTVRVLSTLSYRGGELTAYLEEIAGAVSELIEIDWSAVTLCRGDHETVLASTIDLGGSDRVYALHGTMADTVVRSGDLLAVEDTERCPECGQAPEGYHAYLGVPLRLPNGEVVGTICSFHRTPRTFSADERQIVRLFAERAAIAIDNYQLYQQQKAFNARLEVDERTVQGQVCIEVQNGGNVIPSDLLSRITEPFRTTKAGGSGLGLAIVKRIVNAHEGTLTISSSTEAGTRVSVCLPAGEETGS